MCYSCAGMSWSAAAVRCTVYVYAGEFTASRYQQPEGIDPRQGNKDGGIVVRLVQRHWHFVEKAAGRRTWLSLRYWLFFLHWPDSVKALQLALLLTEDSSACLLLLSPEKRGDAGGGATESNLKGSLRCEFKHHVWQPGESMAYEIENLGRANKPTTNLSNHLLLINYSCTFSIPGGSTGLSRRLLSVSRDHHRRSMWLRLWTSVGGRACSCSAGPGSSATREWN